MGERPRHRLPEPRVVRADNAGLFTLDGTRSFLIGERTVALIDPGPADPAHLEALEGALAGATRGAILLTHRHPDHDAAAAPLARRTGLELRPTPRAPLHEGEELPTDAGPLRVLHTPGHTRDHLSFVLGPGPVVFVGDLILGEGTTTWVGEYAGCVADWLASIEKLEALAPARIFPAHGPPIDDPAPRLAAFREHRLARIGQVEAALEAERALRGVPSSVRLERLVDRVYGEALPPGLREGARWSMRAILEHLGVEPFPPEGAPTEGGGTVSEGGGEVPDEG